MAVKLGTQNETVYPFEINNPNLYLDWTKYKDFKDIEILGMGEATHGTKEFFEIKAKTFEYLVINCNYRVFGIEASYGECNYINDYINSGVGNIDSVMRNFDFWTWRTQEVKDLILWMKNYNQFKSNSEKICFYGFDMQDIFSPIKYLLDFVKNDSVLEWNKLKNLTKPIISKTFSQAYKDCRTRSSKFADTLRNIYSSLKDWMSENKTYFIKNYSNKIFEKFNLCLDNYGQAIRFVSANNDKLFKMRYSCMAYNIIRIHNLEKANMFIWAHNGHVYLSHQNNYPSSYGLPMGGFLKKELGSKYYCIGFVFNQGNFQARENMQKKINIFKQSKARLKEFSVPIYEKNTLTNDLSTLKLESFFIDLTSSHNSIFTKPGKAYFIGAVFYNKRNSSEVLIAKKQFDGLIYINKTTRAVPLEFK